MDGGDLPEVKAVKGGLLGADFEVARGRYRLAKIYKGENWNPGLKAPLTQPGVDVREGEYILSVNGQDLRGDDNIHRLFEGTAGKTVVLRVGKGPSGAGAREAKPMILVVPGAGPAPA